MAITILETLGDRKATKTFTMKGDWLDTKDYDNAATFKYEVCDFQTIDVLADLLEVLRTKSNMFVIHGKPNHNRQYTNRRMDTKNGSKVEDGDISDCFTDWVMFDFDKIPNDDQCKDIEIVSERLIAKLPKEFGDVSYYSSFSSSFGVFGFDKVSVHIWFVLENPQTSISLREWANAFAEYNKETICSRLIDPSVIHTVQPNYTADPVFIGMKDPIKQRAIFVRKNNDKVILPEMEMKPKQQVAISGTFYANTDEAVEVKLTEYFTGFETHKSIFRFLCWYISYCHGKGNDPDKEWINSVVKAYLGPSKKEHLDRIDEFYDNAFASSYSKRTQEEIDLYITKKQQEGMRKTRNEKWALRKVMLNIKAE